MTKTGQHQRFISAIHWPETSGTLALGAIFVLAVLGTPLARAQAYTVLHRFQGSPTDGVGPLAGLIGDSAGNLYGTTEIGGASGYGVVFKVDETGETVLYSFTGGADGGSPFAGVVRDSAGNLYGTTFNGGNGIGNSGHGVVFKLDTTGTETVLHTFTGGADGSEPTGLVRDPAGDLYGTTNAGGIAGCFIAGCGVVFKLDTNGTETVLYSFTGGADGAFPSADLIRDSAGNLYGTAYGGGIATCNPSALGCGVVFKLDTTGTETVLHSFTGGADGAGPVSLVRDSVGNLYGTSVLGGTSGSGVVFKVDTASTETVLYSFRGGADGGYPIGLIRDSAGNLYGTAEVGGTGIQDFCFDHFGQPGCGVVFKLDTTGTETVLYSFTGRADGATPYAGVKRDSAGNLYGTTSQGGIDSCLGGCGVVFKLTP